MISHMYLRRFHFGFTLLEVLLAIALFGIVAAISFPLAQSVQVRTDIEHAAIAAAHTLRRAQVLSQTVEGDAPWGVSFAAGTVTLFKGASWASRDPAFDEVQDISSRIVLSGISEVVFAKLSGEPVTPGSMTFTGDSDAKTVNINAKGMVSF